MISLSRGRLVLVFSWALVVLTLGACGARSAPPKPDGPLLVGAGGAPGASAPSGTVESAEDDAIVPIASDDAVRGSRLAPVTIVVFSDFECPFCSRHETTLERLREEYGDEKLRLVFKNNPLPFHAHARLAAEVGQGVLALAGQEGFWRYQAMAFRRQGSISAEAIRSWATLSGVDERSLEQGLGAKRWTAKVDTDIGVAKRLNANGTPASFVNGILVSGAQGFERFKEVVDAELVKAGALVERGTPRDKVYTRLAAENFKAAPTPGDDDDDDGAQVAQAKTVHKVPIGASPIRGPATALVTLIEFSDYQCPYCKKVEETLARIRREYGDKVRIVWRDLPLNFHPRAEPAAQLARAARAQKGDTGFWAMHDLLFDSQAKLEDADLERLAREAKLDVAQAMLAVRSHSFRKAIDADADVADDFKASGTPHFFVNGRRFVGAQTFDKFKPLIDEEIAKAEALVRSGTPLAGLYEALTKDGQAPAPPERKTLAAPPPNQPFRGAANGKILIQEVGDFQCPFCARAEAAIDELLRTYPGQLKVVWRDKPLPMHPDAPLAAEAAREAFAQKGTDGFTKMHKLLFGNPQALKRDDLDGYARNVGLDMTKFGKALDSHAHKAVIDTDDKTTTDAGVRGTPAFFIGPHYLSGAQAFGKFRRLVDLAGGVAVAHPAPPAPRPVAPPPPAAPPVAPAAGLVIKDLTVGTGRAAAAGDRIKVHYVGTLSDGTEFDQSRKRGAPFAFELGKGVVIKGWDQGVVGMKVGGKRKLTIPADLAYGDRGAPGIPPKSTLLFDVELIAID